MVCDLQYRSLHINYWCYSIKEIVMRKNYFFLLFGLAFLLKVGSASAQMVGTNCYLQGRYLEIGMNNNSSFGTCSGIPPTYHPHMFGTGIPPAGSNLAEVYDAPLYDSCLARMVR